MIKSTGNHVTNIVSHCCKTLKDIRSIKKCLDKKDLEEIVHAGIASRLDYCELLLQKLVNECEPENYQQTAQTGTALAKCGCQNSFQRYRY